MKIFRAVTIAAAAIMVAAVVLGPTRRLLAADDDAEMKKRIAELETGQKAILKELQEIKLLLQRQPPMPMPAGAQNPLAPPGAPGAPGGPQAVPNLQSLTGPPNFDLDVSTAPVKGKSDAKLVVVEFSDFQCPFCGRYSRDTFSQVERDYVDTGKARYFFRNFPLEKIHPFALRAAEAAECARPQGKFWDIHTKLFANQQALAEPELVKTAQSLGLNMTAFQACFAGQAASPAKIRQDQAEGIRAGITGTPTFFLGTMTKEGKVHALRRLVGAQPYAAFKTTMDQLLSSPELK